MIPPSDAFDLESFQRALLDWYRVHARPLPWRRTTDPYAIWVSEVMLQQTRVDTVLSYYRRFLDIFPNVASLADAAETQVLKAWEGLGYYGRARNLHRTAKILCERYGGIFPDNEPGLRSLPGIGNYIVAAVLSFAFGKPFAVLDGNVLRVLARLFSIDRAVNDAKARSFFQQTAQMLLPSVNSDLHNQAMMELGALVCTPKHPRCMECPVDRFCTSRRADLVDRYPIREAPRKVPTRRMVIVVLVRRDGRMLLIKRPSEGLLGGLWEFPNAEIDAAMSFEEGMRRLCASMECGSTLSRSRPVGSVRHAYTHFKVAAEVFQVDLVEEPNGIRVMEFCDWLDRNRMDHYPLSKLTHKVLRLIGKEDR
uniref:Adenine DNA glycosylase n=1 Tax=Desulfatirhabdium butyrativorans TaxID=340467 RepID=A0A7C4MKJ0_9BACT